MNSGRYKRCHFKKYLYINKNTDGHAIHMNKQDL